MSTAPAGFTANLVHADRRGGVMHGGVRKPVHTSVQYGFERVEDLIDVFQGKVKGVHVYTRQSSPTVAALEAKINQMEGGVGTICFATGMAAVTAVFFSLLKAGDHLVCSHFVFGNTNSLCGTLTGLGVQVTRVDPTDAAAVAAAMQPNTRMVFVESLANPGTQIPDFEGIAAICQAHAALFVVDNTVTSPWLFQPGTVGADLVINALSKSIAGHGVAMGGSVTDTGRFDWRGYPHIFAPYRQGDPAQWGLTQVRRKGLRDMGGAMMGQAAHDVATGAETLALRVDHSSATALALAQMLEAHPAVARVCYPGLPSHPQHARAQALFKAGAWLLSFELRDAAQTNAVINRLQLAIPATGLADTRTLVIPVAPTIFWEAGPEVRARMDIADGLVRVSVGLEDAADLLADFSQALQGA
ncbi:MAG: cystathionine gamma-synthase family protein [Proteobacteria bacterium]|nr:cystathionine gamma-synthase family protein [Pseudomonadota bacterium]